MAAVLINMDDSADCNRAMNDSNRGWQMVGQGKLNQDEQHLCVTDSATAANQVIVDCSAAFP